jgi:serine/threonine protein kinase
MTQRLGHYRVLDRVGSGATGVVYRARDERLDRDVAIKVLSGDTFSDAARTRLRKEARAISRAVHPAIATIHDLASDGTTDFLVMELVPGPTVADRIAKGPLEEREVIEIGRQLAAGLQAAHAAGVIHRDIKPSNLKITADGRLKILDFGIAQLRTLGTETTRTGTMLGGIAGTLPYMAPEQLHGLPAE